MNHRVLLHVVESNKNLYGKPLDQGQRESLEGVHFDELIEVYGQHLKSYAKVLPKHELLCFPNDVLLVIRIVVVQVLNELCLH